MVVIDEAQRIADVGLKLKLLTDQVSEVQLLATGSSAFELANFSHTDLRTDIGALRENFLISERMKFLHYNSIWANSYFWRTQNQQEIDYVEERDGTFNAFELKWNTRKNPKLSKTFRNAYPDHTYEVINPENFTQFIHNPQISS